MLAAFLIVTVDCCSAITFFCLHLLNYFHLILFEPIQREQLSKVKCDSGAKAYSPSEMSRDDIPCRSADCSNGVMEKSSYARVKSVHFVVMLNRSTNSFETISK